jgi:hypothetical protein
MDSAGGRRKYGFKNIYTCRKCGGKTVTIDVDEGVTPFMLGCRASGQEGDCDGIAESSFYRVADDSPEPQWEWFTPRGEEYHKLNRQMREHVDNGGLDIRKIRGREDESDSPKGYYRDLHGSLRKVNV